MRVRPTLVPALGLFNTQAMHAVEHPAQQAIGKTVKYGGSTPLNSEKMIWYKADITWGHGRSYPGFPSHVSMKWGEYESDGSGWKEKSPPGLNGTWGKPFLKPNLTGSTVINLRTAPHTQLTGDLGLSNYFADALRKILEDNPNYDVAYLISGLNRMEDLDPGFPGGRRGASEQRKEAVEILNNEMSWLDA